MSSGDRGVFDSARLGLLMTLEQMGVGYDESDEDLAGDNGTGDYH